jgi:hypothetical protein
LNGEPDFITNSRTIYTLKDKFKVKAEFQFGDHHERRRVLSQGYDVTAVDFALNLEAKPLKKALNGKV